MHATNGKGPTAEKPARHERETSAADLSGGCLCGTVRYVIAEPPYDVTHCHCADCRRGSGAPLVTWASVRTGAFRFTRGSPRVHAWHDRQRGFCAACGTTLTFRAAEDATEIDVTVASFDQPAAVQPENHTWVEDQLPWLRFADGLPAYPRAEPRGSVAAKKRERKAS